MENKNTSNDAKSLCDFDEDDLANELLEVDTATVSNALIPPASFLVVVTSADAVSDVTSSIAAIAITSSSAVVTSAVVTSIVTSAISTDVVSEVIDLITATTITSTTVTSSVLCNTVVCAGDVVTDGISGSDTRGLIPQPPPANLDISTGEENLTIDESERQQQCYSASTMSEQPNSHLLSDDGKCISII